ncbi:MAG: hypothetical protein JWO13_3497 [Acidobacteriales bacterium]|nr:hypothetical protein [Terriglobales bacterium]
MRYSRLFVVLSLCLWLTSIASAGSVTGVFQGRIVQLPKANSRVKWLYVQGKNGAIRRANIAKAVVEYDDDYPAGKRRKRAADSLGQAIEVRVTAEQDVVNNGDWQATNVLILAPRANAKPEKKHGDAPTPSLAKKQLSGWK